MNWKNDSLMQYVLMSLPVLAANSLFQTALDIIYIDSTPDTLTPIGSRVLGWHSEHSDVDFYIEYSLEAVITAHLAFSRMATMNKGMSFLIDIRPLDASVTIVYATLAWPGGFKIEMKFTDRHHVVQARREYTAAVEKIKTNTSVHYGDWSKFERYRLIGISTHQGDANTFAARLHALRDLGRLPTAIDGGV